MPRTTRQRIRVPAEAVAMPTATGGTDGQTDDDDSSEEESPPDDLSPRMQRLRDALIESSPTATGTVDDLVVDDVGGVQQQVAAGSRANLAIAPSVNPGFIDTEVINRMGLVMSLGLQFDPRRGYWVPEVVDKTERQAVEQTLATDDATDDLTGVVTPGDGTEINNDGDLRLSDEPANNTQLTASGRATGTVTGRYGVQMKEPPQVGSVTCTIDTGTVPPTTAYWVGFHDYTVLATAPIDGDRFTIDTPAAGFDYYRIVVDAGGAEYTRVYWSETNFPYQTVLGEIYASALAGSTSTATLEALTAIGSSSLIQSGTATSTFDNPCRVTQQRRAAYDVCSSPDDVTVDLYSGDPLADGNEPIRRDIDEREDISDLSPGTADLQYHLTLRRAENGESPRVSRLGHQYIR